MATNPTPNNKPNPTTPPGDQSLPVSEIVLETKRKIEEIKKDLLAIHEKDVQKDEAIQAGLNDILHLLDKSKKDYDSNKRKNLRNIFWVAIAGLLAVGMCVLIHRRIQAIK